MWHVAGDTLFEEVFLCLRVAPHIVGAHRAFHPVFLDDLASNVAHEVARRLGITGEEIAHHQRVGAEGEGD